MSRVEQINTILKHELANLISQEIPTPNFLITVMYVDCSPDLNNAKIGISILPDKFSGTALKKLRKHSSQFNKTLTRKLNIRKIPKFNWKIDPTEKEAGELENILAKIRRDEI